MTSTTEPRWETALRLGTWSAKVARLSTTSLHVGMVVETTGNGRTRSWKGYRGTIVRISHDLIVVDFERSGIGEQALCSHEVRPLIRKGCPCAACRWETEHHL